MEENFLKKELEKKTTETSEVTEPETTVNDQNSGIDFKERFGSLRNEIDKAKTAFKGQIVEIKDLIDQREEELTLLKKKLNKLEGAVEASELYLKASLPSN